MSEKQVIERAFNELVPVNTDAEGNTAWKAVCEGLQKREITTVQGKGWTPQNAARYYGRLQKRLVRDRDEIPKPREKETRDEIPKPREKETRDEIPKPREKETRDEIPKPSATAIIAVDDYCLPSGERVTTEQYETFMLELWEAHKAGIFAKALAEGEVGTTRDTPLAEMPAIVVPKAGTSINLNYELRELMRAKAKADADYPHRDGYSWTSIVTWLAWRYMGCPDETYPKGKHKPAMWPRGDGDPQDQAAAEKSTEDA